MKQRPTKKKESKLTSKISANFTNRLIENKSRSVSISHPSNVETKSNKSKYPNDDDNEEERVRFLTFRARFRTRSHEDCKNFTFSVRHWTPPKENDERGRKGVALSRDASRFGRWYFRKHNIPDTDVTDQPAGSSGDHSRLRLSEDSLSWNTLRFTKDERIYSGRRPVPVRRPRSIPGLQSFEIFDWKSRGMVEGGDDSYVLLPFDRSALSVITSLLTV